MGKTDGRLDKKKKLKKGPQPLRHGNRTPGTGEGGAQRMTVRAFIEKSVRVFYPEEEREEMLKGYLEALRYAGSIPLFNHDGQVISSGWDLDKLKEVPILGNQLGAAKQVMDRSDFVRSAIGKALANGNPWYNRDEFIDVYYRAQTRNPKSLFYNHLAFRHTDRVCITTGRPHLILAKDGTTGRKNDTKYKVNPVYLALAERRGPLSPKRPARLSMVSAYASLNQKRERDSVPNPVPV